MHETQTVSAIQYSFNTPDLCIIEVFIPGYNTIFNTVDQILPADGPRTIKGQITIPVELPKPLVDQIVSIANMKLEIKQKREKLDSDLKKYWVN